MKKKKLKKLRLLVSVFLVCLMYCSMCGIGIMTMTAFAEDGFADEYYRLNDLAGVLTEAEENDLLERLDEISVRQKMDVTLVVAPDLDGYNRVADYAEDLYESCKFGYGEEKDGVLLLISMEDRDWYIDTHGFGITAFTDAGIKYIGEAMTPDLADGNYAAAFETYASLCDDFITQARSGEPYEFYNDANSSKAQMPIFWIPLSIVIGAGLAGVVVGSMVSGMKTVRPQAAANSYVKKGSFHLNANRDLFLYHTITRTAKPKENKPSGGGAHNSSSGTMHGSSTHRSASGSTHGGRGGKF